MLFFLHVLFCSWILGPRPCFATLPDDSTEWWPVSLDLTNTSALQSAVDILRDKYFIPAAASPLQKVVASPQRRAGSTLDSRNLLQDRQTCTGNADNHCFADSATSFCSNCWQCCTQASGGYCCDPADTCCPADTTIAGHQGCCASGAICDSTLGCVWPTVTITTTSTALSTAFVYYTSQNLLPSTTIVISTLFLTQFTTLPNAKTATIVDTTVSKLVKRDEPSFLTHPTGVPGSEKPNNSSPEVVLAVSPNLDTLEEKLREIGLLVKRAYIATSTVTVYTSATTTITSTVSSDVATMLTATFTSSSTITHTVYPNAVTTVHITSTAGVSADSVPGKTGLSTGAKAGIGVGTAIGAIIVITIGCIAFFLWHRHSHEGSAADSGPDYHSGQSMMSGASPAPPIVPQLYHNQA